jgi:hypothetical protein
MDDLVDTKLQKTNRSCADPLADHQGLADCGKDPKTPTLFQLQEKQCEELLEIAQVRYGIKGGKVNVLLTPLEINIGMTEAQVFKILLTAPEHERADQVLYELAKGNLDGYLANRILAGLALLIKFKNIKIK